MGAGAQSSFRFLYPPLLPAGHPGICATVLTLILTANVTLGQFPKVPPEELAHIREELGVNTFTAPSIDRLLRQLSALQPIRYDKLWRPLPKDTPQNRPRMALVTGVAIAEGFLAVAAEKQSRIEPAARALLRLSKGLGIGDKVVKRGQSVLELAATERWAEVRTELVHSQAEVEAALLSLKDEEIAHLVAIGGWIRGLEIVSTAVEERYTPERALVLQQPELLDYFQERMGTLNPTLAATPMIGVLRTNTDQIFKLFKSRGEVPPTEQDVARVRQLASEMVSAVCRSPEQK